MTGAGSGRLGPVSLALPLSDEALLSLRSVAEVAAVGAAAAPPAGGCVGAMGGVGGAEAYILRSQLRLNWAFLASFLAVASQLVRRRLGVGRRVGQVAVKMTGLSLTGPGGPPATPAVSFGPPGQPAGGWGTLLVVLPTAVRHGGGGLRVALQREVGTFDFATELYDDADVVGAGGIPSVYCVAFFNAAAPQLERVTSVAWHCTFICSTRGAAGRRPQ